MATAFHCDEFAGRAGVSLAWVYGQGFGCGHGAALPCGLPVIIVLRARRLPELH